MATPNDFVRKQRSLQKDAEKEAMRAYDRGDKKLSREYFFVGHEMEGFVDTLKTVLRRARQNPGHKKKRKKS